MTTHKSQLAARWRTCAHISRIKQWKHTFFLSPAHKKYIQRLHQIEIRRPTYALCRLQCSSLHVSAKLFPKTDLTVHTKDRWITCKELEHVSVRAKSSTLATLDWVNSSNVSTNLQKMRMQKTQPTLIAFGQKKTGLWGRNNATQTVRGKWFLKEYAWEFGGWDLFCISFFPEEWGSGAGEKEELGNSRGLIVYRPPKSTHPAPTTRWCH